MRLIIPPNSDGIECGEVADAEVDFFDVGDPGIQLRFENGVQVVLWQVDLWVLRDIISHHHLPAEPHPAKYRGDKEMTMHEAICKWAIDHFGPDCGPTVTEGEEGLMLSVTRIEGGTRQEFHLPLTPLEGRPGWFSLQGVTLDTNPVH